MGELDLILAIQVATLVLIGTLEAGILLTLWALLRTIRDPRFWIRIMLGLVKHLEVSKIAMEAFVGLVQAITQVAFESLVGYAKGKGWLDELMKAKEASGGQSFTAMASMMPGKWRGPAMLIGAIADGVTTLIARRKQRTEVRGESPAEPVRNW